MKFFILVALVVVAAADQSYQPAPPAYKAQAYVAPAYKESYPPQPYKFAYEVKDAKTNNDFGQSESSDGKVVTGNYYVQLPDGRMEIVNYKADGYGYNADVQYKGEAKYPEYKGEAKYPEYKASPYAPAAYKAPAPAPYAEPAPAPYVSAKY